MCLIAHFYEGTRFMIMIPGMPGLYMFLGAESVWKAHGT